MDSREEKQCDEEEREISIEGKIVFSVDKIVENYIGGFGRAQLFQVVVIALGWSFDAQNTFLPIFTDVQPSWRCANSTSVSCTEKSSICEMDRRAWEWDRGKAVSVISEWDLICTNSYKAGIPQIFFFVGALLGQLKPSPYPAGFKM
ncbi:hypothetical protein SUGI_1144190 [Cryptomeria japonica]|nr:hypothetical protein SUGI_1144190 [Cryptomeria japonica]